MAFPICKVKNIHTSALTYQGKELTVDEIYSISDADRINWANDDYVIDDVVADKIQIGDATEFFTSHADQISCLQNY